MVCKLSLGPFCRMEKIKIRDLQNTCKQAGCKHLQFVLPLLREDAVWRMS